MMDLIATGRLPYGTRVLKDGDPLRVPDQDGRVLVALGRAKMAPPKAEKLETKALSAEDDAKPGDQAHKAKRKYHRRDLTAE